MPRLNSISTKLIKSGNRVFGTWSVLSFPLPNILLSLQYFDSVPLYARAVYNDYMTVNMTLNSYISNYPYFIYVNEISKDRLTVHWSYSFEGVFSMRLIAITYDYLFQKAQHHELYNHSGI